MTVSLKAKLLTPFLKYKLLFYPSLSFYMSFLFYICTYIDIS